ncbi:MAG: hypothetical protein WA691_08015 [Thermoplasmata archaeon]
MRLPDPGEAAVVPSADPSGGNVRERRADGPIFASVSADPMSCIERLLRETGLRFEPELKNRLNGPFGGFVRTYLPQAWVFATDDGIASLLVDKSGAVSVVAGAAPHPDVTLTIPHDRLVAALRTRDPASVPPGSLAVTAHSAKGKTAFEYLRSRLGL